MEPMNFDTFHFHQSIMAGIQATGYATPTPIQAQAIPLIMQGKDVIGLAATGTGKTAAFILPILNHLCQGERGSTRALILSPTPEESEQTGEIIRRLGRMTGLEYAEIYGEMGTAQQIKDLRRGPDIIIGCPGRLLDYLWKGKLNLSNIEILVIDEADRMFDLGILPDIFNILMCIVNKRQTLLFSATLPENIRRPSRQFLSDPVTVEIDAHTPVKTATRTQKPAPHIPNPVKQNNKTALLNKILSKSKRDSVLVYAGAKNNAERVAQLLVKAGYQVTMLQGNLSKHQQQVPLKELPAEAINILVVTDTASRGIDVSGIFRMINYDKPGNTSDNAHRLGGTGRVDKNGDALTLVTSTDTINIHALEQLLDTPLEVLTFKGF